MANALYGKGKESLLKGEIDLVNAEAKVLLVASSYAVDIDNHQFVSDVGLSNIVNRSDKLDNATVTLGVFDAENETIEDYGNSGFHYLIIYIDSGDDTTSRLLVYIDTATGLPVTSTDNTISITIQWSDLASKIFAL